LFVEDEIRSHCGGVWYSKRFPTCSDWKGKRVILRFDSVTYRAQVFLNGIELGSHEGGYTPFEFEITNVLNSNGENLLCLRVDQTLSGKTIPQGNLSQVGIAGLIGGQYPDVPYDFFPYSGIHRNVTIYTTSPDGWLETIRIDTKIDGKDGIVAFSGICLGAKVAKLKATVVETGDFTEIPVHNGKFSASIRIPNAKFWAPGEPNLYNLDLLTLNATGEVLDEYRQRFGIREIRVSDKEFLINGKPFRFQGFGKHEDFPVIGKGLCEAVTIRDFELMKWLNANSFRTTHYPYAEETLDLADEYGFAVISETPAVSLNFKSADETTLQTHLKALEELIERDYNHPCVVMWSLANEPASGEEKARPYFKTLVERAHELDKSRPVTMVSCFCWDDKAMDLFDVCSINTYPGWYWEPGRISTAVENMRKILKFCWEKYKKPVLVTEFGADTIAGFHALPGEVWTEEYQKELLCQLIDVIRELDFTIGEHVWNFADFKTAQHYFRAYGNRKGVFTRDRNPKLCAHFLREKWK
ncbi:MAG: beta-glucuronidase, partial [Candidatus Nanoarchaeia archaeon]